MRRVSYSLILIVILILVSSCRVGIKTTTDINYQQQLLAATLFQQCAAEMKALSYQAYNIAGMRLEEALKEANDPHHLAVILDLDETVLDNSPHSGQSIIDRFSFPIGWDEWCYKAEAKALPGAVDFLKKADKAGVQIFYITNSEEKHREATKENLLKLEVPVQSDNHLMFKTVTSSKIERQMKVSENYEIIMLIGDNLTDFTPLYDKQSVEQRDKLTDSLKIEFGNRFIVLPNTMYGDWMSAIHNFNFSLSDSLKTVIFNDRIKGFNFHPNE